MKRTLRLWHRAFARSEGYESFMMMIIGVIIGVIGGGSAAVISFGGSGDLIRFFGTAVITGVPANSVGYFYYGRKRWNELPEDEQRAIEREVSNIEVST